jgi:hypothetical protein
MRVIEPKNPNLQAMRYLLLLVFILSFIVPASLYAQSKTAVVKGTVVDEENQPMPGVSVYILGKREGKLTNDSGAFTITVPVRQAFALVFSRVDYKVQQKNFFINQGEEERVVIRMERVVQTLESVVVTDNRPRREAGLVVLDPKQAFNIPSPTGGIESLIKIFVGSNNELTSNYSVRGGNYDENLIYVNDFEIFRPYLVRSGQQEGLSFINPELTRSVLFYNGGFQAKYGDKLSSVLDIQYKRPRRFGGSAYIGLLEQGIHIEGASKDNRLSYLVGFRNRNNQNLLSSQETQGNYVPSSTDLQALLNWQFKPKWTAELLTNWSSTQFKLDPTFSQQTSSVFSPLLTANLGLDTYFEGRERDAYRTRMVGTSLQWQQSSNLRLKWLASYMENKEEENIDITGTYLFGEREFDRSQPSFGLITNPLGAGAYQTFARNRLKIGVLNLSHKGYYNRGKHYWTWGLSYDCQQIDDQLREWERQDSAGYSLPYAGNQLELYRSVRSSANLSINRFSGFVQDNLALLDSTMSLQAGVRFNYNDLNGEWLITPRVGMSWMPAHWKRDIVFKASAGLYHQPPFYRELRRYDGSVNTQVLAQKSWQVSGGFDYQFIGLGRPLRFTAEAYYKQLWDVVPYDIDNVRIRYYGENNAKAYATGLELRLFGELVKDAESWVSLGFMRTREDIENDFFYNYSLDSLNQPTDSVLTQHGWLRRPTDRLITVGLYFQDYLSTNKNFKVYLNTLYGTNMPYNIPNNVKYRNALTIDPYLRIDIGFSALLLNADKSKRRSHSPFRDFDQISLNLEVFNLIDRANTISYQLIKDFSNTVYTIPNRLTPRLLNIKLLARW